MRRIFTVGFLLALGAVQGQDITGIWRGHFQEGAPGKRPDHSIFDDRYKFEVQVAQDEKSFEAVTYSYLSTVFYGKADAKGTVNPKTKKVLLQEGKLLEMRMVGGGSPCTMTCFLQYTKLGDVEFLEGSYVSMNIRDSSNCGRGTIMLRKVATSDFFKEPFLVKKEEELKKDSAVVKSVPAPLKKTVPGSKTPGATAATRPPGTNATGKTPGTNPATKTTGTTTAGKTAGTSKTPGSAAGTDKAGKPLIAAAGKTPGGTGTTGAGGSAPKTGTGVRKPATAGKIMEPSLARVGHTGDTLSGSRMDPGSKMTGGVGPLITPEVLRSRSNELVRTITVNTNEVILNIYDDGAIDNDTISVYLDKKQVISHAMLTDRAIVLSVHLDDTENYHELVMVAENEGTIPPNTSLMIVKAGDKQYEVRITSTEQKNAVVIFKYDKNSK